MTITVWNLDFSISYHEIINEICNQEQLDTLKLKYDNVDYIKYYYGQIEVGTSSGNCDELVEDLYEIYKCPVKISIENDHDTELSLMAQSFLPVNIGYHPSLQKYESNPSDSENDSEIEDNGYAYVDKIYNNWKASRPVVVESEKVKKLIKILDGCCFSDTWSYEENVYDYTSLDKEYMNWVHTRPHVDDFECEESIRIIKVFDGCESCYCSFCT